MRIREFVKGFKILFVQKAERESEILTAKGERRSRIEDSVVCNRFGPQWIGQIPPAKVKNLQIPETLERFFSLPMFIFYSSKICKQGEKNGEEKFYTFCLLVIYIYIY